MKKLSLILVTVIAFTISGCSSSSPIIEDESLVNENNSNIEVIDEHRTANQNDIEGNQKVIDDNSNIDSNNENMNDMKMENINFPFDKYKLNDSQIDIIDSNLEKIEIEGKSIKLEGNCDEWGSDEYNFALGLKRANSVKNYMINSGIDEKSIIIVTNGKSNPICDERTRECWSKNRRVEIIIK